MNLKPVLTSDTRPIRLTYCTNVHPLADGASWRASLALFGASVRQKLGWETMPLGLWWQAPLAREAAGDLRGVTDFLREHKLDAFTCNAFPYGNFHDTVVKTKVYRPNWTSPERLEYTQNCARLLAAILPEGGFGSISTLPLGWRLDWKTGDTQIAIRQLLAWVEFARRLESETGRRLALALEPEPGCVLERTSQVLRFWKDELSPAAASEGLEEVLGRYLGLCYDTCHQAVQFENAESALTALMRAGIPIHKMQLSSALVFPSDPARTTKRIRESFAEPKFLHQTRIHRQDGSQIVADFDDLPEALATGHWDCPWRTHYHLPLQAETMLGEGGVGTTRQDMLSAYAFALKHDLCRHFEVETYTWSVLPEAERPGSDAELADAIAGEITFVIEHTPEGILIN